MSRTITTTVYTFPELSSKAKDAAREWMRGILSSDMPWQQEHGYSRLAVLGWLRGIDRDADPDQILAWLDKHASDIAKECPFTGYCGDEDALNPVRNAMARKDVVDRATLMDEVEQAMNEAWEAEYEAVMSDKYIDEHIISNGYEFTIKGDVI